MMCKEEIKKLFDFNEYYENEEFDVELFDDILLLEEELIPLDRVEEFTKLLVPVWEKEENLQEITWYNIDAGRILASWGYKEGLDYLKTLIAYGFKDVLTLYPHRLYGYDQVYEYVLDAFTNYVLNLSDKGKKKEALKEVYPELCNIIERAKEEFISLSWFKYKMKDGDYYQLFKKPLKETLDHLRNKEKKSFLDDYNIEDINKALLKNSDGIDNKIKNILYIKGHWESGHDGQYPIVLDVDTNNIAKPFLTSEGWGWGLMGGQHSFKNLCSFIEDYNREESKTVYEILKKSCEKKMSNEEVVELLMTYIEEKEKLQKDFSNSVGMMDCIFGNDE